MLLSTDFFREFNRELFPELLPGLFPGNFPEHFPISSPQVQPCYIACVPRSKLNFRRCDHLVPGVCPA